MPRSVCSARVRPSTTGSTASRWLGFDASVTGISPAARRARRVGAEVVLDVAGAALRSDATASIVRSPSNSRGCLVRAAERVREHVEAAAVRHPDHDLVRAGLGRELDRLVEHRDQHVEALDRELLLAEERAPEVALEALDPVRRSSRLRFSSAASGCR